MSRFQSSVQAATHGVIHLYFPVLGTSLSKSLFLGLAQVTEFSVAPGALDLEEDLFKICLQAFVVAAAQVGEFLMR